MDSGTLDQYLMNRPIPTLRLTLSSGDRIEISEDDDPYIEGLILMLKGNKGGRFGTGQRLVSIPNIALIEPIPPRPENAPGHN